MPAILFGSISTVADTSELQREAFNEAFADARPGLALGPRRLPSRCWRRSGGQQRIADYAAARGEDVDAAAVHRTKSEIFQQRLADARIEPRPGVVETITAAPRAPGIRVGAGHDHVAGERRRAARAPSSRQITADDFDLVVDSSIVDAPEARRRPRTPSPLGELGEHAGDVRRRSRTTSAASRPPSPPACACVAFPNENTAGHDFDKAGRVVDHVDLDELRPYLAA